MEGWHRSPTDTTCRICENRIPAGQRFWAQWERGGSYRAVEEECAHAFGLVWGEPTKHHKARGTQTKEKET